MTRDATEARDVESTLQEGTFLFEERQWGTWVPMSRAMWLECGNVRKSTQMK